MLVIMIKQMYVVMLTPELLLCSIPEDCRMVPRVCSHCHLCTDLSLRPPLLPGTEEVPGHQTAGSRCSSPTCCSTGCTRLKRKEVVYISNSALSIELQMIHQFSQSQTTRALFWLKAPTTSPFRFKTLFRHNAKHGKYVKLGRQCIGHKGRELSTRRRPVIVKTDVWFAALV